MELRIKKILRLECVGIILIFILAFIFDFYPKIRMADELKKEIKLTKKSVKAVSESEIEKQKAGLREKLSRKREKLQAIQQAVREVKDKVVREENALLITNEMVNIAVLSKIELASVKSQGPRVEGKYRILPVEINFQCMYVELIRFLSNTRTSSVAWVVPGLSINKNEAIYPKLDIRLTAYAIFISEDVKQK